MCYLEHVYRATFELNVLLMIKYHVIYNILYHGCFLNCTDFVIHTEFSKLVY